MQGSRGLPGPRCDGGGKISATAALTPSLQHLTLRMHGAGRCHGADCAHTRAGHPKVLRGRLPDPQAPHTHGHGEGDGLVERAEGTLCPDEALKQPITLLICNCRWAR